MADYIDRESLVTDMRKRFCEDCDRRKGKKNGRVRFVYDIGDAPCRACWVDDAIGEIEDYPSVDVIPAPTTTFVTGLTIGEVDVVKGSDFRDCRNELCMKCGRYTEKHLGACDGCRWESGRWSN